MFQPPCCPWGNCTAHKSPPDNFFQRWGTYDAACQKEPVPRFRCRLCKRTFSRQTFRHDYRDKKPHLNVPVFAQLSWGCGMREFCRRHDLSLKGLAYKLRKHATTLHHLRHNVMTEFPAGALFQLDEMETFEQGRVLPLTLPILIEANSMFLVDATSAPIRFRGKLTAKRRRELARAEQARGRRTDQSREAVRQVLQTLVPRVAGHGTVTVRTDLKSSYGPLLRQTLGAERLEHQRFSSALPRSPHGPLARINLMAATLRDVNGRLRRRTWLVSKSYHWLNCQLELSMVYRSMTRCRFNRDRPVMTPAMCCGFLKKPLKFEQCLSWRQDWGERSIDVESRDARPWCETRRSRRVS